jgi:hypothetical protein
MSITGELKLLSGRHLYLRELRQHQIYEGLLEGLPTREGNARRLEQIITKNRGNPYAGDPYLIAPTERPIEYRDGERYPFGTPSSIPSIACVGRFDSLKPARDLERDYSGLVVIWFQAEYAFPVDSHVIEQLLAMDWDRHAVDMDY